MNTEQIELLPCPFCRGAAVPSSRFDVICTGCGAEINSQTPEKDWNRRDGIQSAITAATADLERQLAGAERHIQLAGGYHQRTKREIEIAEALDATPADLRDSADNTIAELLELVDAGRNRVHQAEAERDAIRDQLAKTTNCQAQDRGSRVYCECDTCRSFKGLSDENQQLRAATAEQAKEIERLREALDYYGLHRSFCELTFACGAKCTCGLSAALAKEDKQP